MNFVKAKRFTPAGAAPRKVTLIVIHTAECSETPKAAENVAAYFAGTQAPQASAHYTVDCDSVVQSVLETDTAWHAGPVNGYSIGIEHAGKAGQTAAEWADEYSQSMLEISADLVADLCKRYGIPPRRLTAADLAAGERSGICGHVDITHGLQGGKGHWDPGPDFPWNQYLSLVEECLAYPAEPDLDTHARAMQTPDSADLVPVECNGVTWLVAPVYYAPVSIGQAVSLAADLGYELPSPELVDAIWKAADLKLEPLPRRHNGTIAEMATEAVYLDQGKRIGAQIADRAFHLLAGAFKDVVVYKGKVGLYGWHRLNGIPIQPYYAGHSPSWIDYSQGLRLVKRAPLFTGESNTKVTRGELGTEEFPWEPKVYVDDADTES